MNLIQPIYKLLIGCLLLSIIPLNGQEKPERFLLHKVKKKETLYGLARKYNITVEQIVSFNPLLEKIGLKRKMELQIPVYPLVKAPQAVPLDTNLEKYLVKPKETKWRLAYRYGLRLQELESLNPQIVDGLKVGQEIVVPKRLASETKALEDEFNYYKVKSKEGFYRLEKKLGVSEADLVALNPNLPETGLQEGMILKIPPENTGDLKIENDLLVEKSRLVDSVFTNTYLQLVAMLPFKTNSIEFDSIEQTRKLLKKRNLHTISLDFLMGIMMAIEQADSLGITSQLQVVDTQNKPSVVESEIQSINWSSINLIIGPLIPSIFDFTSAQGEVKNTPILNPLSSKKVNFGPQVYQSVSSLEVMRESMKEYLNQVIDTSHNVLIIADTLNARFADRLADQYPFAHRVRPEEGGFIKPLLVDSLLTDSLSNKVIFETQDLGLATNVTSLLNTQAAKLKDIQLYTTLRTPIYENENISRKHLGNIKFTYASGSYPNETPARSKFQKAFQLKFGDLPSKEAFRAYDVTLDAILRLAYANDLFIEQLGETDYLENRFHYVESNERGYKNVAFYLLQHQDYNIIEIKK